MTDCVTEAKRVVETYLDRSMAGDADGARRYMTADCEIVFTGGRAMAGPEDPPAFNARRYAWVKKRFLRTDAVQDPDTGDVHVWNTGYLYGEWPDGTPFDGNRYVDFFAVRDGLIRRTEVWNDSAEILLDRAGLAEAPL
jgi:ketosteroid isomerase-like protein